MAICGKIMINKTNLLMVKKAKKEGPRRSDGHLRGSPIFYHLDHSFSFYWVIFKLPHFYLDIYFKWKLEYFHSRLIYLNDRVMHFLKKKQGRVGFMGIKLDMSKAYDWIEWKSLHRVLQANGIGEHFCRLVMFCVNLVRFFYVGVSTEFHAKERTTTRRSSLAISLYLV